jgi:predicted GIY-YIG superfamily endonuclease
MARSMSVSLPISCGVSGNTEKAWSKASPGVLVWYEQHETMLAAIAREKELKEWRRDWKLRLIEAANPQWRDLYPEIL